ncbi:hypothetical protein PPYR_12734 [Photinus pyralis]|uniref:Ketimine reductase mu-crystallin n=1 Tax=Photinus pyralis TaxID=7054 RepID=A0A5N4A709_PHOPY|nr:ketimine reductase mu-crystallin-like [Photinus pyralis]KAB0793114.1 hypothetical protein PPYR_12734 [Photinus pyralis]
MPFPYEYISDERVKQLLTWPKAFEVVERAMASVSTGDAFQTTRKVVPVGNQPNLLFVMPGYLKDPKYGALVSMVFTKYGGNPKRQPPLPIIHADMAYMDEETGVTKAVIACNEAMEWVTAAASVTATKHLHGPDCGKPNRILAVIGAGHQGRIHAIAFQKYFNFAEVRIWNRTASKAENVAGELNKKFNKTVFTASPTVEECVRNADVIITATDAVQTLVKYPWVKKGAHINAIGVSPFATELDADTYKASKIYCDYKEGAEAELKHISALGGKFEGQVGDVITGKIPAPSVDDTSIFQSLGMPMEYCAIARLIYDLHKGKK